MTGKISITNRKKDKNYRVIDMARPKKTLNDLPKDWQKKCIAIARQGGSDVEIRVALGCMSNDLWGRLLKENKEFSETIEKAHLLCQNWWEVAGRKNLKAKNFQTGLWTVNMKNRFKWTDKVDIEHSVDAGLAALLKEIGEIGR